MRNKLTKEELIEKLGIESFNELTKDKVLKLGDFINDLGSETAKSILEEFPDFTKVIEEILSKYKTIFRDEMKDINIFSDWYNLINEITDTIYEKLDKGDLSFEEKEYIIITMLSLVRLTDNGNKKDRQFINIMTVLKSIATKTVSSELLCFVNKI